MKRLAILFTTILFCSSIIASAQEKGYYGLLEASGGYIYKYVPGSETAPQDFMLGVSYVNGYRFSPHFAMGLGVGVNYYFDFEQFSAPVYLHLTADLLKRDITPYISLNIGNNFQLNGGKYNYGIYDGMSEEELVAAPMVRKEHYRGFFAEPSVGVKFNCGGKRANLGLAYAFDGVLNRTTDAYRRRNYPQFRLKFGVEF
jgi:hypothetical protein